VKRGLFIVFALLAIFCAALALLLMPARVPTKDEADTLLQQLHTEQSYEKRAELTKEFLHSLCRVMADHGPIDDIEDYTFGLLKEYFLEERDEAILEALDRTTMDGGFANDLSGFYYDLRNEPEFLRRYRENESATDALGRCVGLAWSYEEYYSLLYSGDDSTEIDEKIALKIARGPALRLGYKVLNSEAVCEKVDSAFTVTFFSESSPEQEEVSVLIDSRNANVIAVTDLKAD